MSGTNFRKGDLVEYQGSDEFIGHKAMGRVAEVAGVTGPHARQVRVSWFNDTYSFVWPREVTLVASPDKPVPEHMLSVEIDVESKTIKGIPK